jgi:hypothetical protein
MLALIFIGFRFLDNIISYVRSKCVIEMNVFERHDFWESRNVEISISSVKLKLYSLGIICNALLFVLKFIYFWFLSYPRTTCFRKLHVRFLSIDPWGLNNWWPTSLSIIFMATSYIGHSILYYHLCHSFLSESSLSS